jgi:hypothetical protein
MVFLVIKYALKYCTKQLVEDTVNSISRGSVVNVEEQVHTNKYNHTSKSFRIRVICTNDIQLILDRIAEQGFAAIIYDNTWDSNLRKYVDRYWKVTAIIPRLMEAEEQSKMGEVSISYDDLPHLEPCTECTESTECDHLFNQDMMQRALFQTLWKNHFIKSEEMNTPNEVDLEIVD